MNISENILKTPLFCWHLVTTTRNSCPWWVTATLKCGEKKRQHEPILLITPLICVCIQGQATVTMFSSRSSKDCQVILTIQTPVFLPWTNHRRGTRSYVWRTLWSSRCWRTSIRWEMTSEVKTWGHQMSEAQGSSCECHHCSSPWPTPTGSRGRLMTSPPLISTSGPL